jgi:hypothetical protein
VNWRGTGVELRNRQLGTDKPAISAAHALGPYYADIKKTGHLQWRGSSSRCPRNRGRARTLRSSQAKRCRALGLAGPAILWRMTVRNLVGGTTLAMSTGCLVGGQGLGPVLKGFVFTVMI